MTDVEVRMEPDSFIKTTIGEGAGWRDLGRRIHARDRQLAPVSSKPLGPDIQGPEEQGGALRDSLFLRYTFGGDPSIQIGSGHGVGDNNLNLLNLVENGTDAHTIAPKGSANGGSDVLVFTSRKWGLVITPNPVHHPGTKANKFIERGMQQILHEAGGLTLVGIG